jgi:hypothetical protein
MTIESLIAEHPWMERHFKRMRFTLPAWRAARWSNPAWPSLSKYGKVVWFIFHQVGYIQEQP